MAGAPWVLGSSGPHGTGPCEPGTTTWCATDYRYDAPDRLATETADWTDGPTVAYDLDAAGNITKTDDGTDTVVRTYVGAQLDTVTVNGGEPVYYHYDLWGNTGCISGPNSAEGGQHPTKLAGDYTRDGLPWECATSNVPAPTGDGGPTTPDQLQAFRYDYKDRLIRHETSISSTTTERASLVEYVYDGLGRTAEEHHTRYDGIDGGGATVESATRTELEHIATTSLVSAEHQFDVTGATPVQTETTSYGYDAGGLRLDQVVEDSKTPTSTRRRSTSPTTSTGRSPNSSTPTAATSPPRTATTPTATPTVPSPTATPIPVIRSTGGAGAPNAPTRSPAARAWAHAATDPSKAGFSKPTATSVPCPT